MRFCGQGRKWCGKICIDARHTCRKGQAANKKQRFVQRKKLKLRKQIIH